MVRANESQVRPQPAAPLIKDTAAALPPLETAPLRAGTVLENLAAELNVPTEKLQPLLKEFAAFSSRISVAVNQPAVLPQNSQPAEVFRLPAKTFGKKRRQFRGRCRIFKTSLEILPPESFRCRKRCGR